MEDVREGTPARGRRRRDRRVVRANDIAGFLKVMGSAEEDDRGRSIIPEPWRTYALGGPLPPEEAVAAVLGEALVAA